MNIKPNKKASQDLEDILAGNAGQSSFRVDFEPHGTGTYHICIDKEIATVAQALDAVRVLEAATEGDEVIIHLQTPGGSIDVTDMLVTAMQECRARLVVKASGSVLSAGTVILLNAPEFILSEGFNALIHNGDVGFAAKYSDWASAVAFHNKAMQNFLTRHYKGFLTDIELEGLLAGKDFWMGPEEFITRYEAKVKLESSKEAD